MIYEIWVDGVLLKMEIAMGSGISIVSFSDIYRIQEKETLQKLGPTS